MSFARWTGCRARFVRERATCERAIAALESRLGRAPTDCRDREASSVSPKEELGDSLLDISRSSIAALDELWTSSSGSGDPVALVDTIEDPLAAAPEAELAVTEIKEVLGDAIAALPEREKLVVTLYYFEELTLARDRRSPRRYRVARFAASHQSGSSAEGSARWVATVALPASRPKQLSPSSRLKAPALRSPRIAAHLGST